MAAARGVYAFGLQINSPGDAEHITIEWISKRLRCCFGARATMVACSLSVNSLHLVGFLVNERLTGEAAWLEAKDLFAGGVTAAALRRRCRSQAKVTFSD